MCYNGNAREISCGIGYKFNPMLNHCDFEANVVCNCVGPQCPATEPINTPCPCPLPTTTACPCPTTTACPCHTTTSIYTTSEYSTPEYTKEDHFCIFTTPPPEEDKCAEGVPDDRPVYPHTTPPPDKNVCAEGSPDEPELIYCPPGTRC